MSEPVPTRPAGTGPLRVAIVTDAVAPFLHGGKETLYADLAKALGRRNDVTVHTQRWWGDAGRHVEGGIRYRAVCGPVPLYTSGRRSIRQGVGFGASTLKLLARRFDVIDADHMPYFPVYGLWAVARLRRTPLVVTWHEVWEREYWNTYLGGRKGVLGWWMQQLAMRLPDHIIAVSQTTADRLVAARPALAGRVSVVPNGIDLNGIRATDPVPGGAAVVGVGRLLSHKRWDLLVDAAVHARDTGRAFSVTIVGQGPEERALRDRIAAAGIGDLVTLRTDVDDRAELLGIMRAGRVFALPSEREGFGIVVLEALAADCDVVTTDGPHNLSTALVSRSARGTVCRASAEALADAIIARLADESPRADDPWLADYGWDRVADSVEEVCRAALAARGR